MPKVTLVYISSGKIIDEIKGKLFWALGHLEELESVRAGCPEDGILPAYLESETDLADAVAEAFRLAELAGLEFIDWPSEWYMTTMARMYLSPWAKMGIE